MNWKARAIIFSGNKHESCESDDIEVSSFTKITAPSVCAKFIFLDY